MREYYDLFDEAQMKLAYEKTYSQVYNYFYYLTLSREWTEDLTSKTYLRVLEKRILYDSEKAGFLVWILKIAKNIWMDEYRKNGKWKWNSLENVEEQIFAGEEKEIRQLENQMTVEKLLSCLSEKEKEIVCMRYFMDLSYQQIADVMALSEKNVSVILSRSLRKMRIQTEKDEKNRVRRRENE